MGSELLVSFLLIGLASCSANIHDQSISKLLGKEPAPAHREPHEKSIYEQEYDRFTASLEKRNFTYEILEKLYGDETLVDSMRIKRPSHLAPIIGFGELRRLFGLKQQPRGCDAFIQEEPIDPKAKTSPKALRDFHLIALNYCQMWGVFMTPSWEAPDIETLYPKAQYALELLPEIRDLFKLKYEEMGINEFTLEKETISKAFLVLTQANSGADYALAYLYEEYFQSIRPFFLKKYEISEKLYKKIDEERRELEDEDF